MNAIYVTKAEALAQKQELQRELNSGIKGTVTLTSTPTPYVGNYLFEKYNVYDVGTYTNFKDASLSPIEVTSGDLDGNFVFIEVTNGVAKKVLSLKPVPDYNTTTLNPTSTTKAETGKTVSEFVDSAIDWKFPYKTVPTTELQKSVSSAVKELYINNYDSNYNYYLIGFARNLDLSVYGYSTNEYVIKVRKIHKVTLVAETWKLQFGDNSAISDIPAKLNYLDKFLVYVDWSKFPNGGNFDVDEAPQYLLTENLTNVKSFPNLFPQNIKENNDGKNVYLYGSGSGAVGGEFNLGIGKESMSQIVDASYNLAIGRRSMKNHQSGAGNIAIGMDCMLNSVECIDVTMIGWEAGKAMIQGVGDTGVGRRALGLTIKAGGNTAFGDSTLYSIQYDSVSGNGGQNVAVGYTAGEYCISMKNSIMIGLACARNVVGGSANVIVGDQAMLNRTANSTANVTIGASSMISSTGNQNVVIGSYTMANNVGGNENVIIGYNAGNSLTSGARNVFVGNSVGSGGTNVSDSIAIGDSIKPTKNNQIMIGNSSSVEFVICGVVFTKTQLEALKALL